MAMQYQSVTYKTIAHDSVDQRIDNYLMKQLKIPKSRIYQMIRKGEVRVNKSRIKPAYHLSLGDVVRIPPALKANKRPQQLPQSWEIWLKQAVIYEDQYVLCLNKPAGVSVHGGSGRALGLIEALRLMYEGPEVYLELVHRIDQATTGCVLIAKKRSYLKQLQQDLIARRIKKYYLAIVSGRWPRQNPDFTDTIHLERVQENHQHHMQVVTAGKVCRTHFQRVATHDGYHLLRINLLTGRTHQIRAHTQALGIPILGDTKYGLAAKSKWLSKQIFCLHASQLHYTCPMSKKNIIIKAPLSMEFNACLKQLKLLN